MNISTKLILEVLKMLSGYEWTVRLDKDNKVYMLLRSDLPQSVPHD